VLRESREEFVDDLMEKRMASLRADFARWKAERAGAKAERIELALTSELGKAQQKLQRSADQARERLLSTRQEMDAKLSALREQAAKAPQEVQGRIEQRIAEIRKDFGERETKLRRAHELAQEALQP
jgi:hypothetical protein